MKYIKTFEGVRQLSFHLMWDSSDPEYQVKKDQFKFEFGDYVRMNWKIGNEYIKPTWNDNQIYFIHAMRDVDKGYYLKYNDDVRKLKNLNYGWVKEEDLKLVPDYELDAIKYNL